MSRGTPGAMDPEDPPGEMPTTIPNQADLLPEPGETPHVAIFALPPLCAGWEQQQAGLTGNTAPTCPLPQPGRAISAEAKL